MRLIASGLPTSPARARRSRASAPGRPPGGGGRPLRRHRRGRLVLRLIDLGDKPFHHDESLHAWFAWQLVTGDGYHYDPVYHGPVQFYLIALAHLALRRRRLRRAASRPR